MPRRSVRLVTMALVRSKTVRQRWRAFLLLVLAVLLLALVVLLLMLAVLLLTLAAIALLLEMVHQ